MRAIPIIVAALLAAPGAPAGGADEPAPDRRQELEAKVEELLTQGVQHYQRGDLVKAQASFREALAASRALYPPEKYPDGHPRLANSLSNLAVVCLDAGELGQAEPLCREALRINRAQYPKERFPRGDPELALSLSNLGSVYMEEGEYARAEPFFREALAMRRALFPKEQFPDGHPHLGSGLNNLAGLYLAAGEYGRAEPLFKEALAMNRALFPREQFPRGHPRVAIGLNNLAGLYVQAGEYGKAEPLFREALDMGRALFPKEQFPRGHPGLAASIHNLSDLLHRAGEYDKALPLYREALDMSRALYPREQFPSGHPHLAASLVHLAGLREKMGEYDKALPLYREALDMHRALYPGDRFPHGHPSLASCLDALAGLYRATGECGRAEPLCREALAMTGQLLRRHAELTAEAECLNYLATQPATRDALLSATRRPEAATPVYDALWDSRAALTRLLERRHRDLMASRDKDTADLADQLRLARLTLAQRLLRPDADAARQGAEVQKLTDAKEDLEKRIAHKLRLAAPKAAPPSAAERLVERLPEGAAFVDLYRYADVEQDPNVKGEKGRKRTGRYVAFVVRRGRPAARVELGEAAPVERAWAGWRQAIPAARPDEPAERRAAADVAKLVWDPLRRELPAGLKTVYLAPDGVLHQVPWAALPGSKPDSILLDEHAMCLVPHGPFLLERLGQAPPGAAPGGRVLAVGGVDYDGAPEALPAKGEDIAPRGAALGDKVRWPALPGTDAERRQVAELARRSARLDVVERSGKAAGTEQLQRDLPGVRYAHIATHGFFADPTFRSALQLDPREFGRLGPDRRGGARSPSVLSGLVLAGANRTGEGTAEDRGILTAEGIIGLRLEGLELAVLSACETGLGEDGGGEGVYGLQRACHVAGCKDVIASLWKVDDGATRALMALFYRNLWEKKLDPAEALRQAQLTLFRHPDAVEVARKRGADFSESDLPKLADRPAAKPERSPAAHWAAFTFSGVRPAETRAPGGD